MQLYTEQDFNQTKKILKQRCIALGGMFVATGAIMGVLVSVLRNRPAVIIATMICFCLCYAFLSIKLMPWFRYWRYQVDMREGLSRETDAWFVSCSDQTRLSDGVAFHEFIVRVDDSEDGERLFFWDGDKELPALTEGQQLHIKSFGNYITELVY